MLNRAYQAGVLTGSSWVSADEAYGQNPAFRDWLADREIPFVLATRNDDLLTRPDGHRRPAKVPATIAGVGDDGDAGGGWESRSIGPGAHGDREYDWTAVTLDTAGLPDGWGHWLLVRRQTRPGEGPTVRELAFYRCASPAAPPLRELIRVRWPARWAMEECFQTAKNEAGLDHYQVRTLAMLATAYLAATRAREHQNDQAQTSEKGALAAAPNS
jgi:SRSO17 transposase